MNEDFINSPIVPVSLLFVLVTFVIVFACIGEDKQKKENLRMNIKLNIKVLFGMWIINLIVFTTCLWLGSYAIHSGMKWIEYPINATLISTGAAKIFLSVLLFVGMTDKKEADNV